MIMDSISKYSQVLTKISEFVKKLDESVRVEAFKFLLAQELQNEKVTPSPVTQAISPTQGITSRSVAPQELIRQSGISTFTDKAVVLIYWLEEFQQRPTFSSGELKAAFEQAREQAPKNPSDLVAKLEATARIMKAGKTGSVQQYRLTSTAIQDVQRWLKSGKEDNETE